MNLANRLTLLRILLVPIFLILIAVKQIPYGRSIATAVFILASLTDKLDGYIARSRNQVTRFGKFMDPLADKLLVTSALISLVELQVIPGWAAVIIIAREFAISGLRTIAASDGIVIAASWWGKIKTVVQIVALILLLLKVNIGSSVYLTKLVEKQEFLNSSFQYLPNIAVYLAVIITVVSGIDYFKKNRSVINTEK
ncbi:CDP-diacylglycerol--glycerol-3-phosphate 3-phosphatidyltransferase [Clostridium polyendosporum]|uniref:CDP-diacylglycerol--glycerol-3-phosphate 3-phosphatidyltransferase n=1 Tax=Clostridium polyendosporum TaxID=69208 RepID=A0A919RWY1_9CLOT|nr:CDP-diacylglycerol--glycerol-3-phosphate 3-phosphatidyltransferase [Clostridium polyendosporum]GIM27787.1 CDP-diacylglycerol--glycerol-3-phosphate 3-phosphatidyltransferase [Clostridium polyendosporum]